MVKRLRELPEAEGKHLPAMRCPSYEDTPGISGKPLSERRIGRMLIADPQWPAKLHSGQTEAILAFSRDLLAKLD